ncbi:8-amino-7-oxononanoate synthase [Alteribacillus bidgolensis]|uniref:8-amino-7-ketopelargonate synthase n=1 Tax=Alteribacillus bidgolensis TaxID=930129 RepID=A0A1G8CIW8_9BACI|nr:8-amino-7-oxononanoate synthase [Alteribacillus bidgolensis]SDH45431.1 8-amino-7-oxononanoate synthase [Alteribacillus bidgolensis]
MIKPTYSWVDQQINDLKKRGLYRHLRTIESGPASTVEIEGKEMLIASSNNYLGLAADQRLIMEASKVVQQFGVGSTGSRLTTGNSTWHEKLEKRIAAFKKEEAAIVFSSGYLANVGVISALAQDGDVILSDELNHASLIDGCRLSKANTMVYRHVDMNDLKKKLQLARNAQNKFIVTDSVFSMDGNLAPLPEIKELADQYNAFIIVDDAHATGVLGENGRGSTEHFHVEVDITIGTFSKAIGTEGGFAAGSFPIIELLRNKARSFIFQTALPPGSVAAAIKSIDIIEQEKSLIHSLRANIEKLQKQLAEIGFVTMPTPTPIIPVLIGEAQKTVAFSKQLEREGIFAPAIRPPTVPEGKSRIRLTVMASHTDKHIQQVSQAFYTTGKNMGVI